MAEKSKQKEPVYNKGLILINEINIGDTPNFEIFDGRADRNKPTRIVTRRHQVGIDLDPEDIAALLKGENLEVPIDRKEGEKPLARVVFSTGVVAAPRKGADGKTYTNHYLNVRSALVNKNAEGKIVAYSFTHPEDRNLKGDAAKSRRNVSVYASIKTKTDPICISPAQANALLDGESVEIEGRGTVRNAGIKPNAHGFLEVDMKVDWLPREKSVAFASDDGEGEPQPVSAPRNGGRPKQAAAV